MPWEVDATAAEFSRPFPLLLQRTTPIGIALLVAVVMFCVQTAAQEPPTPPQSAQFAGLDYYANAHPYLEEPLKQLVKHIPELRTIRPATDQDALPMILAHAGARVGQFFENIVDLSAREEVVQEISDLNGDTLASQRLHYNYLILLNAHETPPRYEEYRTDLQGQRAEQGGTEDGYAVTAGFALKCIYFLPALQSDSTYRYLGDQTIGSRNTYVVAFAQRPAQATFWGTVTGEWGTVRILDQGIAWIDRDTFQIIRIRTDLLAAHSEIGLARQTTEVEFNEVHIPDVPQALWLPSEADVYAGYQGHVFRNKHHYTDYERFRVSVKMGTPKTERACAQAHPSP